VTDIKTHSANKVTAFISAAARCIYKITGTTIIIPMSWNFWFNYWNANSSFKIRFLKREPLCFNCQVKSDGTLQCTRFSVEHKSPHYFKISYVGFPKTCVIYQVTSTFDNYGFSGILIQTTVLDSTRIIWTANG